ncbi:dTDP-4-dehydrorhamnose 3,5-epimerase [Desulfoluna spongiiphila]|uniref:dTDP-4-dehydrorhamnose 3,5-epimerase n=1 Tax=Desulfoluna spongiiphila TaxID=419481 RepID=UPI0012532C12|nr:dTDP-4-dehydrorhamnose 3,5-epimerase [Desulfoluna spongiiphila]VVS90863.1 dtdp-4-dehydrorhamnose 3 5-epimerase-related [Desulfoluna spongiiphila]
MQLSKTGIKGCYIITPNILKDKRGHFVKTLHEDIFNSYGLHNNFPEEYYSKSKKNVLRGLHFHVPPHDHIKMVYCVFGRIIDAIVDLRIGSSTYGEYRTFEISDKNTKILYIAKGIAHGFLTLSPEAIVIYKVSSTYSPNHDTGILWNSVGIPWQTEKPILSERDKNFPVFQNFDSPFKYKEAVPCAR